MFLVRETKCLSNKLGKYGTNPCFPNQLEEVTDEEEYEYEYETESEDEIVDKEIERRKSLESQNAKDEEEEEDIPLEEQGGSQ